MFFYQNGADLVLYSCICAKTKGADHCSYEQAGQICCGSLYVCNITKKHRIHVMQNKRSDLSSRSCVCVLC